MVQSAASQIPSPSSLNPSTLYMGGQPSKSLISSLPRLKYPPYDGLKIILQSFLHLKSSHFLSIFPSLSSEHSKAMATNEYQGGFSLSMSFRGRSLLRRNQVVSMEQGQEQELHELDLFHSHVADRLLSLLPPDSPKHSLDKPPSPLLSLAFLSKLLDTLLAVEAEFRLLLPLLGCGPPAATSRPVADLLDRAVKSLDLCNAVSLSLHSLRHWLRHAQIAASALLCPRPHLLRARRALSKLLPFDAAAGLRTERRETNSRFLSWSMSRNCSAHLAAPRGGDGSAGELAGAVYTMSAVLVFAMWALGTAFPCQERGGPPVAPPRQLPWAAAMVPLQERIADEWRRRDRKAAPAGLLAELQEVERCGKVLMEVVEEASGARVDGGGVGTSLEMQRAEELAERAAELAEACRTLEEGLGPLERQVREVFHRVVGSRAEVLRCLDQSARSSLSHCLVDKN